MTTTVVGLIYLVFVAGGFWWLRRRWLNLDLASKQRIFIINIIHREQLALIHSGKQTRDYWEQMDVFTFYDHIRWLDWGWDPYEGYPNDIQYLVTKYYDDIVR